MKLFIKKTLLCATVAMFAGGAYADVSISGKVSLTSKFNERTTSVNGDDYESKEGGSAQLDEKHSGGLFNSHLGVGTGGRVSDTVYIDNSNNGNDPEIKLKHASLNYTPVSKKFSVTAGKMHNSLFVDDIVVDKNYNPDGANVYLKMGGFDINTAAWMFKHAENSTGTNDAYLIGISAKHSMFSVGYYEVKHPGDVSIDTHNGVNNGTEMKPLIVGAKHQLGPIAVHGKYIQNLGKGVKEDKGYSLGGKYSIGDKISLEAEYRKLEENALFSKLTDSDFDYAGKGTDVKGFVLKGTYKLGNSTKAELKGVRAEPEKNNDKKLWMVKAKVSHSF